MNFFLISFLFFAQIFAQHRRRQKHHYHNVENTCTTKFVKYQSSPYEAEWTSDILNRHHAVCSFLAREPNEQTLLYQVTHENHDRHFTNMTRENMFRVFSIFVYERFCTEAGDNTVYIEPIEPLVGYMRDHRDLCRNEMGNKNWAPDMPTTKTGFNDRRFLLLPSKSSFPRLFLTNKNQEYVPRVLVFNIGCGSFLANLNGTENLGDSQAWFLRQYPKKGFKIERVVLWESIEIKAVDFFSQIPSEYVSKYQFFNTPVSGNPADSMYPWTFLKEMAHEYDYIVVKLDVRDYATEISLLKAVLSDPDLIDLIDEMFFEFHVRLPPVKEMEPETVRTKATLVDAYDMYLKLRQVGLRMHGWP